MRKAIRSILGSFLFVGLAASLSHAQGVQRTFVSGLGNDGNPCSRTAPCRTFGQAISQTAAGGEVIVLDSAGYGAFTISQSVSITAPPGLYAGISVFSGTGIVVNTAASDKVILRGLTINNQGGTGDGISFSNLGTLHVENCVVNGFSNSGGLGSDGLAFAPAGSAVLNVKDSTFSGNFIGINILGGTAHVEGCTVRGIGGSTGGGIICTGGAPSVKDTTITDCANGISLQPSSATLYAVMDHIAVNDCQNGVFVQASGSIVYASIRDSAISNCAGSGIIDISATSGVAYLFLERCLVRNAVTGLLVSALSSGNAFILISDCTIAVNGKGYNIVSDGSPSVATIYTRGNNTLFVNGASTGTLSPFSAQ